MGEAKGGRRCAPIGRKAIRAEFCGSIAALRALRAALENAPRFLSSAPCRARIPAQGSKKPAAWRATGFSIQMVPPTGFEPVISTLKGWRPWPLDDGDSAVEYTRYLVCEKANFHVNSQC